MDPWIKEIVELERDRSCVIRRPKRRPPLIVTEIIHLTQTKEKQKKKNEIKGFKRDFLKH